MKKVRSYLYSIIQSFVFVLSLFFTSMYVSLLFILILTVLLSVLDKLGRGIVIRELIALFGCFICLVMPWVGYEWFSIENPLSKLWVKYMMVPFDTYFSFALPAMSVFVLTLCWPINKHGISDEGAYVNNYVSRARILLAKRPKIGLHILIIGVMISFMRPFLPSGLAYVTILFYWGSFAGFLYVYFTPSLPYRVTILISFSILIMGRALQVGMFTVVAYMGITMFSFLFLGRKSALWKKMSVFLLAVFFLFIIQSVKNAYRQFTWTENYSGNKSVLFGNLVAEKITHFDELFSEKALFPLYSRTNQGWNVSLVMKRFPKARDFDHGDRLLVIAASSFVPRFLWQDKPEAGGKFNMEYYANYTIVGWSTNVGPLGEAYGSFGVNGGIFFMFILGSFIRWAYVRLLLISRKVPFILFWIPLLFYEIAFSMETDTLSILNSLVKGSFFIWLLYKFRPDWFGIFKKKGIAPVRQYQPANALN